MFKVKCVYIQLNESRLHCYYEENSIEAYAVLWSAPMC